MSSDRKEITINLLRGRNCDNCLYHSLYQVAISGNRDEYCHFKDTEDLPKLRICKDWKECVQ